MLTFYEAHKWLDAALIPLECQISPCNRSFIHCTRELLDWGKTPHLIAQAKAFRLFAIRKMRIHARQGRNGCHGLDARVLSFCALILQGVIEYRKHIGLD